MSHIVQIKTQVRDADAVRAACRRLGLAETVQGADTAGITGKILSGAAELRGRFGATHVADVLCGGDVDAGSLVNEEYLMALERKHFCSLLEHPKTQERVMGMLQTGKPVRN